MSEVNRPPWNGAGKKVIVKTAAEYVAEANGANHWACPRCGCKDWRGEPNSTVEVTRHPSNKAGTVRKRICRHCGQFRFQTIEVIQE